MMSMAATGKTPSATPCPACETDEIRGWPRYLQSTKRNDPGLTSLCILAEDRDLEWPMCDYFRPRDTEDWQRLGEAIATNTNLRRLDLICRRTHCLRTHCGYSQSVFRQSLKEFNSNLSKNSSIRRFALNGIDLFNLRCLNILSQFIENHTSLISLSATNCLLASEGTRILSSALARRTSSLKYLDLSRAGIADEECQVLVVALRSRHSRLRSLELNGNFIRSTGCVAIASLLSDPNSMLIRVYLDDNSINDEGAVALADGLASNKCLKTLSIHENEDITTRGYAAFSNALCNAPNINDILLSNHKIERLGADCNLSTEIKLSLRLNRATNKRYVANQKVVMHHLVYNCNINLFETIPGSLVPSVLAMIAVHAIRSKAGESDITDAEAENHCSLVKRNDYKIRRSALHCIIRLCPSLCERRTAGPIDDQLFTSGRPGKNVTCGASKRMRLS